MGVTMKTDKKLLSYVQEFFQNYLTTQRGVSVNTIHAYRDVLKLFLNFVQTRSRKRITRVTLSDLNAEQVLAFLKDLEESRNNSIMTRNHRLTALKAFFSFLASQDVLNADDYQKITVIPLKRSPHHLVEYLEVKETKAILHSIDRSQPLGERDYVLLTLMYNTGARVQEICDLKPRAFRLDSPASVLITGKGSKTRQVPLWSKTAKLIRQYLEKHQIEPADHLFLNGNGMPLGRFGVRHMIQRRIKAAQNKCPSLSTKRIGPHTFRHTTAMHLLQSGVDLTLIKTWLGHVNLATTHTYIEIDMEMKRKALAACRPMKHAKELKAIINQNRDVIEWLESI